MAFKLNNPPYTKKTPVYHVPMEDGVMGKANNNGTIIINKDVDPEQAVTSAIRMKHPIGHEYQNYPVPPSAGDVEGGAKFVNRADDFMVVHRYT